MKRTAWVIALVAGVTGCSGAIVGGDGSGGAAGAVNSSAGSSPEAGSGGRAPEASGGRAPEASGGRAPEASGGLGGGGSSPTGGAPAGGSPGSEGGAVSGYEPAPSCSSTVDAWVAFDSDAADFNRDLYVVRPDGSALTRLTSDASEDKEPYFSPSGDRLSFTSDRSGSPQIYIMDLASRAVTQLTNRAEAADQSSFSPDGQLLAFHSGASIFTIKPDGSEETLIATGSFNPYFSPHFIGNDQLVFDHRNEINAIDLDQTNFRSIVGNTTTTIIQPSVSPAGSEIAYATWCPGDSSLSIWTAKASARAPTCAGRRVTPAHDPLTNQHPSWGPENMFAYERVELSTNIGRITLINRAIGSRPCSLTDATQDSRNPNWSPEGLTL